MTRALEPDERMALKALIRLTYECEARRIVTDAELARQIELPLERTTALRLQLIATLRRQGLRLYVNGIQIP